MMLLPLLLLAQAPQPITELFPYRARLENTPPAGAWARLPLTEAVLSKSEPTLSDVRLIDGANEVVPFVVRRAHEGEAARSTTLRQVSSERRELPGADDTPHGFEEKAVFQLPSFEPGFRQASLVTAAPTFVRRATLEVLGAKGEVLSVSVSTVFRLELGQEELTLPLETLTAEARQLRLTLVGQDGGFLSPIVSLASQGRPASSVTLEWPLTGTPTREGTVSVWRVEKPRGVDPMRLRVESRTPWFDRRVEVRSAHVPVASGRLVRRDGKPSLKVLEVPFFPGATGEQLEVRVENGDSPPLEEPRLTLIIEQPELVFAMPNDGRASLVFGGRRTRAPRFDTAGLPPEAIDDIAVTSLGTIETNPGFEAADPLKSFRRAGAALTTSHFAHEAAVRIEGSGPLELHFDAAHAMTMRSDFHDLRIVDDEGRQWPYVLRTRDANEHLSPTPGTAGEKTILSVRLAVTPVALTVVLPDDAPYFSRRAQLRFTADERLPTTVWSGSFTHQPEDDATQTLRAELEGLALGPGLYELEIDDGNDAALKGLMLDGTFRTPQLLTVLEPGNYRAMWGAPGEVMPQYDLGRVTSLLETMKVEQVSAGAPKDNASYVAPGLLERAGGMSRLIFWAALVLAVGVLAFLALRVKPEAPTGD